MTKKAAKAALAALVPAVRDLVTSIGRERVRLGVLLSEASEYLSVIGASLPEWAAENGVDETPPTVYRMANAGSVARVLGDETGDASVGSLVPLYRVLTSAKTDEEKAAAEEAVRGFWAEAVKRSAQGKPPTEASVAAILAENASDSGTRGKKAAKGEGKKNGGRKGKTSAPTAPPVPWTPEKAADREGCANALTSFLRPFDSESRPRVLAAMLGTAKTCETFSPETVRAILKGRGFLSGIDS